MIRANKDSLVSPVFVCTVPKSGTNLIQNILTQILDYSSVFRSESFLPLYEHDVISLPKLENKIYIGHFECSKQFSDYLFIYPKIVLIRDPRDYVVSQAHHLDTKPWPFTPLERRFRELSSWDDKLSAAILGMSEMGFRIYGVNHMFINNGIKWLSFPRSYLVRFEEILLSQDGIAKNKVIERMRSILEFIGCTVEDEQSLYDDIYLGSDPSRSSTFYKGKIGSWKNEFKMEHVKLIKLVAPGLVSGLGYERDEYWDLWTNENEVLVVSDSATNEKSKDQTSGCNFKKLNYLAYEDSIEPFKRRLEQVVKIASNSQALQELVHAWALRCFLEKMAYQEALAEVDYLINLNPRDPELNYLKALCMQCIGKEIHEAISYYGLCMKLGFNEFWAKYNRGSAFKQLGLLESAYSDLKDAAMLDSEHPGVQKMLKETEEHLKLERAG